MVGDLVAAMGCVSGMTCCRPLRDSRAAGAWAWPQQVLAQRLHGDDYLGWTRASLVSGRVTVASRTARTALLKACPSSSLPVAPGEPIAIQKPSAPECCVSSGLPDAGASGHSPRARQK